MEQTDGTSAPDPSWRELLTAFTRSVDDGSRRTSKALAEVFASAELWEEIAAPVLQGLGRVALHFRDAYDEGVPSGWQLLNTDEIFDVTALMASTGWCLTTTPPARQLQQLLAAEPPARGPLLLAQEARILEDLDRELRAQQTGGDAMHVRGAREAWEAHASGLFVASQATSTAPLSALSGPRGPLNVRSLGVARTRFEALDVHEAGLREVRFYAVARAVAVALATYPHGGREPLLYNRHASAHAMSPEQYTQLNSLTALMLACGWLRETTWLVTAASDGADN